MSAGFINLEDRMNQKLMSVVAVLALATGCVVTSSDGTDGGGGTAGSGGTTTNGGGGTGGVANGGGGSGGAQACTTPDECVGIAEAVCVEPTCEEGVCGTINSAEGVLCTDSQGSAGFCNGEAACVECLSDTDCANGTCNVDGVCESEVLGGVCGDNFCQLEVGTQECLACAIATQKCSNERIACVNDADGNQCDTCGEFFNTGGQNFCPGSQEKAQAFLDCVCTVGVCAE
jgi:hypothetical protein